MEKYHFGLPVPQENLKIFQGYNGRYSHNREGKIDRTYALDFEVPPGTPITAIASGQVLVYQDESDLFYTGLDPIIGEKMGSSTNFLVIQHFDQTMALYSHLQQGCVRHLRLSEGDRIERGQQIGLSGLSGWIGPVPHVHVQVNKHSRSIPYLIEGYNGPFEDYLINR